ncbi:hypothetical protein HK099_005238 [Clydaea vesicula]|uniref:chitin synthase n=1 Tax=Clydaea vesicula TaxID=447962 RepID=A0AAD5UBE5_9FUNG|nr:hypothetical protein HK099_005238 [Clydaea vesicula]
MEKQMGTFNVQNDLLLSPNPIDLDSIVNTLHSGYNENYIYCNIGTNTLIYLHKNKSLGLTSQKISDHYIEYSHDYFSKDTMLPSHIFSFAEKIYFRMQYEQQDQSVIISGDIGSGKSENRKLLINQLCALAKNKNVSKKVGHGSTLTESIKKSETIFEGIVESKNLKVIFFLKLNLAFGHAKTVYSLNSSRFSRYSELQYDGRGKLIGYKTLDYLFEKWRVPNGHHFGERNFNVFYYFLAGASNEEKAFWKLADPSHFHYLTKTQLDPEDFTKAAELKEHMIALGIGKQSQFEIFNLLAAILHLGNIQFIDDIENPQEAAKIKNYNDLEFTAELLGISASDLEITLTYQTKFINKELCTILLNTADANIQRDSLATTFYSLLFSWLVDRLNNRLCRDDCEIFIGITDFTGSSKNKTCSFEDLLVNFAQEKLKYFIMNRICNEQVNELKSDLVLSDDVSLENWGNFAELKFLTSSTGGLLSIIVTESEKFSGRTRTGQDISEMPSLHLAKSLFQNFADNPFYRHIEKKNEPSRLFSIKHFKNTVEYDTKGFLESNIDYLCPDFVAICRGDSGKDIKESEDPLIRELFSDGMVATRKHWKNQNVVIDATLLRRRSTRKPTLKRNTSRKSTAKGKHSIDTLLTSSQAAIDEIIDTLEQTVSWYIFCLRPNGLNDSDEFDVRNVKEQLERYELQKISEARLICNDLSVVIPLENFLTRFETIVDAVLSNTNTLKSPNSIEKVSIFCQRSGWDKKNYALGTTQQNIYLTENLWKSLINHLKVFKEKRKNERGSVVKASSSISQSNSDDDSDSDLSTANFSEESDEKSVVLQRRGTTRAQHTEIDEEKGKGSGNRGTLIEEKTLSPARKKWVFFSWCITFMIPNYFLNLCGMKRKHVQQAWREKVTLCFLIFLTCGALLFFVAGLGPVICPVQKVVSTAELQSKKSIKDPYVYANGRAYQIKAILDDHLSLYNINDTYFQSFLGGDISILFYKAPLWNYYCPGIENPLPSTWDNVYSRPVKQEYFPHNKIDPEKVVFTADYIKRKKTKKGKWISFNKNVYDISSYFTMTNKPFGNEIDQIFTSGLGKDVSDQVNALSIKSEKMRQVVNCMNGMFYIGGIDTRNSIHCHVSNYIILVSSVIIVSVILVKFLAAMQTGSYSSSEELKNFVILQVPCYTEGHDSIYKTLNSLALLNYDDKKKLLFIICDGKVFNFAFSIFIPFVNLGMIIGSGNDRPTPRIVLDILGVSLNVEPEALSFESLGEGDKRHNMGKVYSGIYDVNGRSVPFIVVVKVGKPSERQRPGNRGKRDSQMLLMSFLNRVHYDKPMNPLELDIYHNLQNVIGVKPSLYEFVLMVDADTEVFPDSLHKMTTAMIHDSRIMAFESLFGSVTCLPGCFTMYRIRSTNKKPLLIANSIIRDYSENTVETLHMKNLLHLGEDRYLTTLMLKHFPQFRTTFTADAQCKTVVPDKWNILLSQRRRWINSTVHNLMELMFLPRLCGFCLFSMRFIVFLDLFSTVVQPCALAFIVFLFYSATTGDLFPLVSIVLIVGIYGLQVFIFLLKRKWEQLGWMIIYLLAIPIFSFYIPIYSFWHFDDFSWGNTRVVVGENGKKLVHNPDVNKFDPRSIPLRSWSDHEKMDNNSWEHESQASSTTGKLSSVVSKVSSSTSVGNADHQNSTALNFGVQQRSRLPHTPNTYANRFVDHAHTSFQLPSIIEQPPLAVPISPIQTPLKDTSNNQDPFTNSSISALKINTSPIQSPSIQSPTELSHSASSSNSLIHFQSPKTEIQNTSRLNSPQITPTIEPTYPQLHFEINSLLNNADLMTLTKKEVRETLSEKFGVDLSSKKEFIDKCVDYYLLTNTK